MPWIWALKIQEQESPHILETQKTFREKTSTDATKVNNIEAEILNKQEKLNSSEWEKKSV